MKVAMKIDGHWREIDVSDMLDDEIDEFFKNTSRSGLITHIKVLLSELRMKKMLKKE